MISVTIPNSVTTIGDWAFSDCTGLASVNIPNSVTGIGGSAFSGCTGLTAVHITDLAKWCEIEFGNAYSNPLSYAHNLYLNGEKVTNLTIPNSVTEIGRFAFCYCSSLTSVTIPNSVTSIGGSAFCGCTGLTSVTIPNSVTSISSSAFKKCTSLTEITIPESVTEIGGSAFYNCTGLTEITIPNSVTTIGELAFENCTGLTAVHITDMAKWCEIEFGYAYSNPLCYAHNLYLNGEKVTNLTIPNSVTEISDFAFYNCTGLTSVTIPNSVTEISSSAFYNCTGLTSVTIGNSVTEIGEEAFYNTPWYNNLPDGVIYMGKVLYKYKGTKPENTTIEIKEGTTSIYSSAFYGCDWLTSITIPNSVTKIGSSAFYGCYWLTSITIPNSVTSIGSSAFYGCHWLTSITIPNSVTSIGDDAFYSTPWYNNQPDGVIYINKVLHEYKGTMPKNTTIEIKEGTVSISPSAFSGCDGLTSVTIPNSVTEIGFAAFYKCTGLKSITIGNGVSSIGDNAFYDCRRLKSVHITDLAKWCKIVFDRENPLSYAHKLYLDGKLVTDLVIPEGVTEIGQWAFCDCTGLTSVTIPNSVTSIGEYAFSNCTGLKHIYSHNPIPPTTYDHTYYTFSSKIFRETTLYVPVGSLSAYQEADGWVNFWNIVEMDFSGVEEAITESTTVTVQGGAIVVNGLDEPIYIEVYNLQGQRVYSGYETTIPMNERGIYLVRIANRVVKVVV